MQKSIANFCSQIASDILKFCKCVHQCVRFKRTSSAVLASSALCMHTHVSCSKHRFLSRKRAAERDKITPTMHLKSPFWDTKSILSQRRDSRCPHLFSLF